MFGAQKTNSIFGQQPADQKEDPKPQTQKEDVKDDKKPEQPKSLFGFSKKPEENKESSFVANKKPEAPVGNQVSTAGTGIFGVKNEPKEEENKSESQ